MRLDINEEEEKLAAEAAKKAKAAEDLGKTKLGIDVKKEEDISEWYR